MGRWWAMLFGDGNYSQPDDHWPDLTGIKAWL
jgi:hypothetical protein